MIRAARVVLAALLLVATIGAGELVAPRNVFACSCVRIGTLRDFAGQPGVVVVAGTIHDLRDNRGLQTATLAITRVYLGALPSLALPISGGLGAACEVDLRQATNVVMVARFENGTINPGGCAPFSDISTPEGQKLLAEADATWPLPAPPEPLAQGFDPVQLAIVIVTPFVAIVLIVAVVTAFRRRNDESEAA